MHDNPGVLWSPQWDGRFTRVDAFRHYVNRKRGLQLSDSHGLYQYSIEKWDFWQDLWEFTGIVSSSPPSKILIDRPLKEVPEFFPGARLNHAENLLRRDDDKIAVTAARESGSVENYTHRQLRALVRDMSNAMRAHGVKSGDRIATIITNSLHALVVALAAATVGAMFSSTAPDMGAQGILERYRQIAPKLLFVDTEIFYSGKKIDITPKLVQVAQDLSSSYGLEYVVLLPSTVTGKYPSPGIINSITLENFLVPGMGGELVFEQLPFNHPLWILYSSGTTGHPKCIVHSAGGTLLQGLKEWMMTFDMGEDDCYFHYTTTAWMMFAALVTALGTGGRIILYDGSPFHPDPRSFLKFANDHGVTILGLSPRYFAEIQGRGIIPKEVAPFDGLRKIFVTGAVFTPPMYRWIYRVFPECVQLISASGGTDIFASFVTGSPCLPLYAGEIQGKALGMKVEVFDPDGKNIEHTRAPGELVCTRAHPSMPLYFWNDEGGKKYESAYFLTYPGVWTQGDFIVVNPATRGLKILGRSDGVLNPSGVRFGSAEIYGALERFSEVIDDALCVGQRREHDKDERVLLFLKLREGRRLTHAFEEEVRAAIRTTLSKRHEPAYVFEVMDIPYTVNMKKVEVAVKQIVSGLRLKPSGTVANPESLEQYRKYYDLEKLVGAPRAKL